MQQLPHTHHHLALLGQVAAAEAGRRQAEERLAQVEAAGRALTIDAQVTAEGHAKRAAAAEAEAARLSEDIANLRSRLAVEEAGRRRDADAVRWRRLMHYAPRPSPPLIFPRPTHPQARQRAQQLEDARHRIAALQGKLTEAATDTRLVTAEADRKSLQKEVAEMQATVVQLRGELQVPCPHAPSPCV